MARQSASATSGWTASRVLPASLVGSYPQPDRLINRDGLASQTRRCCTNSHCPARCPPTGSSPSDARRHWSAELGHPIQDLAAEDGLTPLPSWTPGAKAITDDGHVAEERVLHPGLTMGLVKLRLTTVFDAQHDRFATGWSPVSWGLIDELFVNLTMPR